MSYTAGKTHDEHCLCCEFCRTLTTKTIKDEQETIETWKPVDINKLLRSFSGELERLKAENTRLKAWKYLAQYPQKGEQMAKKFEHTATLEKVKTDYDDDTFLTTKLSVPYSIHPKVGTVISIGDIMNMVTNGYKITLLPPKKENK